MRKLVLLFAMLISTLTFAQEKVVEDKSSIQDVIKPYLEKTLQTLEKGAELVIDEVPLVIKEYLMFEATLYGLALFLGVMLLFLRKKIANMWKVKSVEKPDSSYKKLKEGRWLQDEYSSPVEAFYYVTKYGMSLAGILTFCLNVVPFIKVTFFPKIYLIEKFIQLI